MKQQIKNLVKNIKLINFEYGGKVQQSQVDGMVEQAIFDFVRDMCEEQKEICANEAEDVLMESNRYSFDSISPSKLGDKVMECKNVCDGV